MTPRNIIYSLRQNVNQVGLKDSPFNTVIVCFLLPQDDGTVTPSYELQQFLSHPGLVEMIKDSGKRQMLVSLGGANVPAGGWKALAANVQDAAKTIWAFVQQNGFDGVDFDYEDTAAFESPSTAGYDPVEFLASISTALKQAAGAAGCLISHAPQPPYLYPDWYGAPYVSIANKAGDAIDWLNIQYYNNDWYVGDTVAEQTDKVAGLSSGTVFPSSIVGLSSQIDMSKLVLGRLTSQTNGGSGFLDAQDTANDLLKPLVDKFGDKFGGVMGWEFSISTSGSENADIWGRAINAALKI
ncbi:glycosyl hydrolase family 18 protein [Roseibium algae]|uniref:chitinase n=1 Tax=Roseibium algae TaxID=3123038 RepID=A0ABU8TH60_9HYPH